MLAQQCDETVTARMQVSADGNVFLQHLMVTGWRCSPCVLPLPTQQGQLA